MANTPPGSGPYGTGATVTTSSAQVLGSRIGRRRVTFHNPGSSPVAVCPSLDGNGNALAALLNGAGSITILPGGTVTLPTVGNDGCGGAFNGIGSGSQPLTIWEWL